MSEGVAGDGGADGDGGASDDTARAGGDRQGVGERPSWPLVGVVLAVLWLFVNGVELAPAALVGQFLFGLAIGLPVAYVSRRFYWPGTDPWRLVRAAPYMVLYIVAFLKEVLVANVDVAYRVLSPRLPIEPAVVELPLRVRTDVAVTTIANSITLTPGTLTLDYDADRNALTIHAIDGRNPAALVAPIRRWEDYALAIFDEELKPGDPVPGEATAVSPSGEPDRESRPGGDAGGE